MSLWLLFLLQIFAAANRRGGPVPSHSSTRGGPTKDQGASTTASGSDTASTAACNSSNGGSTGGRSAARSTHTTSFMPPPFRAGNSRLFKSFYRTGTLHPEELIVNLFRWILEEQRTVATQRRLARDNPTPKEKRPITFRMLCGELHNTNIQDPATAAAPYTDRMRQTTTSTVG